jgi:glutamate-1-semialdehyde 2,1-aminomutase
MPNKHQNGSPDNKILKLERSRKLFGEARQYLPGGVDSPVRAYNAVGGIPPFIVKGKGPRIYDADGNCYIDYVCSWGPLILGHAHPRVIKALKAAAERGTSFGAPTELETRLAQTICAAMPSLEMLRFVNSGTEAVMSALRLARAFTGRNKILKFSGCYHGHADSLLVKAGSGLATLSIPFSAGVPPACAGDTLVANYNNAAQVEDIFSKEGDKIAAIIVEPVAANMGVVNPAPEFLEKLRETASRYGSLLIFDEVITGFRVAYGGAQAKYNVQPDLTCLGKIIGGGLPVGAYGGRKEIMQMVAPLGPVYQAGTLSGNPLAMTAGLETLAALAEPAVYKTLEARTLELAEGISAAAAGNGVRVQVSRSGSLLTIFFTGKPVTDYESASLSDASRFAAFFRSLLSSGIYWPPSQFEAAFVSLAHGEAEIRKTIEACDRAFKKLAADQN